MSRILCGFFLLAVLGTLNVADGESGQVQEDHGGFRETALYFHNFYRKLKGFEPLQLDEHLSILATDFADKLSREGKLRTGGNYVQNLWSYRGILRPLVWTAEQAVKNWYEGISPVIYTVSLVEEHILYSKDIKSLGFGIGNFSNYTVAVAYYA